MKGEEWKSEERKCEEGGKRDEEVKSQRGERSGRCRNKKCVEERSWNIKKERRVKR